MICLNDSFNYLLLKTGRTSEFKRKCRAHIETFTPEIGHERLSNPTHTDPSQGSDPMISFTNNALIPLQGFRFKQRPPFGTPVKKNVNALI